MPLLLADGSSSVILAAGCDISRSSLRTDFESPLLLSFSDGIVPPGMADGGSSGDASSGSRERFIFAGFKSAGRAKLHSCQKSSVDFFQSVCGWPLSVPMILNSRHVLGKCCNIGWCLEFKKTVGRSAAVSGFDDMDGMGRMAEACTDQVPLGTSNRSQPGNLWIPPC